MKVSVKSVATYKGHSLSENGSVNLSLKFKYDELVQTVRLTQMLNNDVNVKVRLSGQKPMVIGMFRIKNISIGGDGETALKLNSLNDFVEVDNLNNLVTKEAFQVMFAAEVEIESEDEEDEE